MTNNLAGRWRAGCALGLACCALWIAPAPAGAADGGLYDLGYAAAAATACPTTVLRSAPAGDTLTNAEFKRGGEMFGLFLKQLGNVTACSMAMNLYDEKTGKVAPLLGRK